MNRRVTFGLASGWRCELAMRSLVALSMLVGVGNGATPPDFEREVAPILVGRCLECHNPRDFKGGLSLADSAGLRRGGDSGPVLSETSGEESRLLERVVAGEMPPESRGQSQRLPEQETAVLRAWLAAGAPWPEGRTLDIYEKTSSLRGGRDWWSLQSVRRPPVPTAGSRPLANPIDAFVWSALDEHQMTMAPPADKPALVRRAYVDLWGLPPTAQQIAAFVDDDRPDAWQRLIDQLLASPHYGERWARHWLDVVRFAETCGYERDQLKPGIWKYRDWVINALNDDMPYDQFVTQQLAGDEIPARSDSSVIATGMLRAGTWNDEPNDPADYLYERLEDMVDVTSSAFLALTVKCARCHDHKFDPIPQTDYYRLASFFWAGYIGQENLGGPNAEQLGTDLFGWTDRGRKAPPIHLLIHGERHQPGPVVEPGFLSAVPELDRPLVPPADGSRTTQRRLQLAHWITDPQHPLTARVLVNRLWLQHFGAGIVRSPNNFGFKGDLPTHPELLDWLAAELVAPTVALGDGDASGASGAWTLKRMHKLMMTTQAYRQSSLHPCQAEYADRDALNQWLWHYSRRRLDAETLRDSMLQVSGQLDFSRGGPSFYPHMSAEALEGLSQKEGAWQESSPDEQRRRSIYMMTKRSRILPMMTAFDFCDTTRSCAQRDVTIVPTQALALLNNEFVHQQSLALARRLENTCGESLEAQVELAWLSVLGRPPARDEAVWGVQHLRDQTAHFRQTPSRVEAEGGAPQESPQQLALASLCHVLLNTNEFIFVD